MSEPSASAAPPESVGEPLALRFDEQGLIPVVAQDAVTREVALLAYMNAQALDATLASGELTLWSRSRRALWRKGKSSGHTLRVVELRVNCEGNSLLARVELAGPGACHEGYRVCYYRALSGANANTLSAHVVEPRVFDPADVYGDTAQDAALERDARALYTAYERLRDEPAPPDSRTAALLHSPDAQAVSVLAIMRAQQELDELRGVVAGTHQHHGDERDVILEASQVGYWTMVAAVAQRLPYDAWRPHRAWLAGWLAAPSGADAVDDPGALLTAAGALCRTANVHPSRALAADLAAMRRRHGQTGE